MISRKGFLTVLIIFAVILFIIGITYIIPLLLQGGTTENTDATPTPDRKLVEEDMSADIVIKPFKRTITNQGELELEISARQAEISQEKKIFVLSDIDRMVFLGDDGRKYTVSADEGHWDQAKQNVFIKGNVKGTIQSEDEEPVIINSQFLSYDSIKQYLNGGGGVNIEYGPYYTEGNDIIIDMNINRIDLIGDVTTKIKPEAFRDTPMDISSPVEITADRTIYKHDDAILEYQGGAVIRSGKNTIKGGIMLFEFGKEQRILIREGVDVNIQMAIQAEGPRKPLWIRALEMDINFNSGEILLRRDVQATHYKSSFSADEIRFQMDSESKEILSGSAYGQVSYRQGQTLAESSSALFNPIEKQLIFSDQVNISHGEDNNLKANLVRMFLDQKYYLAEDQVRIDFMPGESMATPAENETTQEGLFPKFSQQNPIELSCESAEYDEITGKMHLKGSVRGETESLSSVW